MPYIMWINYVMKILDIVIIAAFSISIFCCGRDSSTSNGNIPKIYIIDVPPYGESSNLKGNVQGANPYEYKVAVYIFIEGSGWFTKPSLKHPLISVNRDLTWLANITTGDNDIYATRIVAFLFPANVDPPLVNGDPCLPASVLSISVASVYCDRGSKVTNCFGYQWNVKNSVSPIGPGPNYFSGKNVWTSPDNALHLKISNEDGRWICPEVILKNSFGYGRYVFKIEGDIANLNENVVLGIFTWDNNDCLHNHREIDMEFSLWGDLQNQNNSQFVVQPWNVSTNIHRWNIPAPIDSSTHSFIWQNDKIIYNSIYYSRHNNLTQSVQHEWTYTGPYIPNPGNENIRINLWLFNGIPPSDKKEVEVVITEFKYYQQ
jgi:hypothetical protein